MESTKRHHKTTTSNSLRSCLVENPHGKTCSFLLLLSSLLLFPSASSFPLCTDSRAPVDVKVPLRFCGYNGSSCCDVASDAALERDFRVMNISSSACGSVVKAVVCTKCDPFSADLYIVEAKNHSVPALCNSSLSANSTQSSNKDFCGQVWDTCKDVRITNSPFAPLNSLSLLNSTSVIATNWNSKDDFCNSFGGATCFDGKTVVQNSTQTPPTPKGVCLERIGNGSYLNMVAHPDGSNRVFLANQEGKIWLATVPEEGSGGMLELDESRPFLDLSDVVYSGSEFGMMGVAFHPEFNSNGRFFVSYNCDRSQVASCAGRCSCNTDNGCDPTKLGSDGGTLPCQYQSVIAEYTVEGSSSTPSSATSANPSEVRRIFNMGLPFTSHHAGQILFGPSDGYLYFMMGDGGKIGDPFNFSQNKKSLLGKIMRLDVNKFPSEKQINKLGLWGNYSIPRDNPYSKDSELQPETWAIGLRNPWRCSFDSQRPSYFFCADVGQDFYEEVNLISKGGNYGWRVYEGSMVYNSSVLPTDVTHPSSLSTIFPVMGYNHSIMDDTSAKSASITGGYVYRSTTDPCMSGRYLYADLYATHMWEGTENPENSGNYTTTSMPFSCAGDSPIACDSVDGSPLPSLGFIFSFGEDNKKDVFVLSSKGVYRIVRPSRCNYTCPIETNAKDSGRGTGQSSSAGRLGWMIVNSLLLFMMAWSL